MFNWQVFLPSTKEGEKKRVEGHVRKRIRLNEVGWWDYWRTCHLISFSFQFSFKCLVFKTGAANISQFPLVTGHIRSHQRLGTQPLVVKHEQWSSVRAGYITSTLHSMPNKHTSHTNQLKWTCIASVSLRFGFRLVETSPGVDYEMIWMVSIDKVICDCNESIEV